MKVFMEFDDGRRFEAVGNTKTFAGLASKSAFKKQFGIPFIVTRLWSQLMVDDPDAPEGAEGDGKRLDVSQLTSEQLALLDDEHLAYLVWLELKRRRGDIPDGKWDDIVANLVDAGIDFSDDEAAETGEGPSSAATNISTPSRPSPSPAASPRPN